MLIKISSLQKFSVILKLGCNYDDDFFFLNFGSEHYCLFY